MAFCSQAGEKDKKCVRDLVRAVADNLRQLASVEARVRAGVAGRAHLIDSDQQGITITVKSYRFHELVMAGGVTLTPIFLARPRIKRHPPGGERAAQGFVVHPSKHEDFLGVELLDNGRHQAGVIMLKHR